MISKSKLHKLVHYSDHRAGKIFAFTIHILILISLFSFSLETLPNLTDTQYLILHMVETVIVILFTCEYLLRLYISKNKTSYIFSFYGLIDLLAILPFYLTSGVDLRTVRLFRLLRVLRIFKLLKYSKALQRFQRAFILVKEEMLLFGFVALITLYLAAVGIYYFEHAAQPEQFQSVFHSLWWALITLTTVGYGDMYPITAGGKLFTFIVLIIGLGIVAVPTGLIATALSQTRKEEQS
ncbi:ion transporter [Psychromonas sp. psych-6C06]|uniref:ion transporter n=1 Tax=Psychromonas sp. psych-6C06 TaxID=2058089 RepID=UPI000C3405BA|nr:ion transporter [Psychromonas sp. psych-6C06]PKF60916.1 ion transporter [Psychromonas sp. psych-6C06]